MSNFTSNENTVKFDNLEDLLNSMSNYVQETNKELALVSHDIPRYLIFGWKDENSGHVWCIHVSKLKRSLDNRPVDGEFIRGLLVKYADGDEFKNRLAKYLQDEINSVLSKD